MYFSDSIILRAVTITPDADGFGSVNTVVATPVWADKHSITRAEYFSAKSASVLVDIGFFVHAEDYANQKEIEYGGAIYDVVRAYQTGEGVVDLTCAKRG